MSHFIIPEDKDENWKESEVMQGFIKEFEKVKEKVSYGLTSEAKTEDLKEKKVEEEYEVLDVEASATIADLRKAMVSLNKIASNSVKYGNESATYQIELIAANIKGLLEDLENGDK